jgi:hypothetical protein
MPRRAMGRGRAVTALATASVAGHTGASGESHVFSDQRFPCPHRQPLCAAADWHI